MPDSTVHHNGCPECDNESDFGGCPRCDRYDGMVPLDGHQGTAIIRHESGDQHVDFHLLVSSAGFGNSSLYIRLTRSEAFELAAGLKLAAEHAQVKTHA